MPTMQSRRHRKERRGRFAACNTPEALARRKAGNDARRMAAPAPIYPPIRKPGQETGEYIEAFIGGELIRVTLGNPYPTRPGAAPRCDQRAVWINGEEWRGAAGLVAIFDELRGRLHKETPKRAIASIQEQYTARDEADAAAA